MGSRFVQVDLDFVDSKSCGIFAARLGTDRDCAAGKMLRVWGWGLEQAIKAPDSDPIRSGIVVAEEAESLLADAARWTGPTAQFTDAGVAAELLERTKRGVRFKGWDERYGPMLRKLRRDANKPNGKTRSLPPKSLPNPARDSSGTSEGIERADADAETDGESDTERDLDHDRSSEKEGSSRSLPASRLPSWQQQVYQEIQFSRAEKLQALGLEPEPDKAFKPAFINTTLNKIRDRCGGDQMAVASLFDRYLAESWPAQKDPPYTFQVFASEKVWGPLIEQLEPAEVQP